MFGSAALVWVLLFGDPMTKIGYFKTKAACIDVMRHAIVVKRETVEETKVSGVCFPTSLSGSS